MVWSAALPVAAAALAAAEGAVHRPPLGQKLVEILYLGDDPFANFQEQEPLVSEMTHISGDDIDLVLEVAPQPVSLYVELGSYQGESALLAARRAAHRFAARGGGPDAETTILAVDTFIGDARVLWGLYPEQRRAHLKRDGTSHQYDRFKTLVSRSGFASTILPLQATSIVGLELLKILAKQGDVPPPQVIYLDSAHLEGEVLLEMELAWQVLAPGGILFGDDWWLGDGEVKRDVLRFAAKHAGELDDRLGRRIQLLGRAVGRVYRGLFLSYDTNQWIMSKLPEPEAAPPSPSAPALWFDCWSGDINYRTCCDGRLGPSGNQACWDRVYTAELCCFPAVT